MLYNHFEYNSKVFSLGKTGTGLPFHHHGEGWLFLAYGRKRWFFYPPALGPVGGFEPGFTSYEWYRHIYRHLKIKMVDDTFTDQASVKRRSSVFSRNNGSKILNANSTISDILSTDSDHEADGVLFKPLECMQTEGQIMYVPEFWWHQVLNLGHTVSIAMQTNNKYAGYTSMKNLTAYHARITQNLQNKEFLKVINKTDLELDALKMENLVNIQKRLLYEHAPLNAVYEFRIGNDLCLMGHRFYEDGRKHLTNAILMDPTYILAYTTLAFTYMDQSMVEKYSLKNATEKYGYNVETAKRLIDIASVLNANNVNVQNSLKYLRRIPS